MKKQKGKSQAQKTRYTANSIKVVPVGKNLKTSTSKREKLMLGLHIVCYNS